MSIDLAKYFLKKFVGYLLFPSTRRMVTSCSSEMSGHLYDTTWRDILKSGNLHNYCIGNKNFQIYTKMCHILNIFVA